MNDWMLRAELWLGTGRVYKALRLQVSNAKRSSLIAVTVKTPQSAILRIHFGFNP